MSVLFPHITGAVRISACARPTLPSASLHSFSSRFHSNSTQSCTLLSSPQLNSLNSPTCPKITADVTCIPYTFFQSHCKCCYMISVHSLCTAKKTQDLSKCHQSYNHGGCHLSLPHLNSTHSVTHPFTHALPGTLKRSILDFFASEQNGLPTASDFSFLKTSKNYVRYSPRPS